jgi:uncharacterized membrane protein
MLQYIPYNTDVAFLQIKQDVISLPYYRLAFFTHVYTSMLVLPAGILQFSKWIRSHLPALHRSAGWMYSFVLLLFIAPSGFIMGIHANGGLGSQIAFCLLSILWIYFTLMALWKIKQRDMLSHQHFMIRSFALTLSAITLRGWKYVLVMLFHPHPMDVYRITAWLGWGLNLLIAEMMIAYFFSPKKIQAT